MANDDPATRFSMPSISRLPPAPAGKRVWISDDQVRGLAVRVTDTGHKSWWFRYKVRGEKKAVRIGSFPDKPLVQARKDASKLRVIVDDGGDPAVRRRETREAPTMRELWAYYWDQHAKLHKRSADKDLQRWKLHVEPEWGTRTVESITYADVAKLKSKVSIARQVMHAGRHHKTGGTGAANRTLALVSKMFSEAEKAGMRSRGTNPVRGTMRFKERRVERLLSDDEYRRLFDVLGAADIPDVAADVIRVAVFTGCRIGEVLGLRRADVDLQRATISLRRTKTEPRVVPLSPDALAIVKARASSAVVAGAWLFSQSDAPAKPYRYSQLDNQWRGRIRRRAELDDVRLHDLRHGFASVAAAQGYSLPQIGALLGHKSAATTQRYVHLVDAVVREGATAVGSHIRAAASGRTKVVALR